MSFSITRGKEMSHLKIIDAKYKAGDDIDFGTVIGELKVEDEKGNIIYYTNDEFDSCPTFQKMKKRFKICLIIQSITFSNMRLSFQTRKIHCSWFIVI